MYISADREPNLKGAAPRAAGGLDLEPQHAAEARRGRPPLSRILEGEGRLRRVLHRDPHALQQVDEKNRLEESDDRLHQARSPIARAGAESAERRALRVGS